MSATYPGLKFEKSPLPCLPEFYHYEASVTLVGVVYLVEFQYNRRGQFWALSIYDADGTPRIQGRKMVANWPTVDKIPQACPAYGQLIPFADSDVPLEQVDLGAIFTPCFLTLVRE